MEAEWVKGAPERPAIWLPLYTSVILVLFRTLHGCYPCSVRCERSRVTNGAEKRGVGMQNQAPKVCSGCKSDGSIECRFCHGTGVMQLGDTLYCSNSGCSVCPVCDGVVSSIPVVCHHFSCSLMCTCACPAAPAVAICGALYNIAQVHMQALGRRMKVHILTFPRHMSAGTGRM